MSHKFSMNVKLANTEPLFLFFFWTIISKKNKGLDFSWAFSDIFITQSKKAFFVLNVLLFKNNLFSMYCDSITLKTRVQSLNQEDPTCFGAAKPMCHNYRACALESKNRNYWDLKPQLLKPVCPRAHAPQQEKPMQWEGQILQLEGSLSLPQLEKIPRSNEDSAQP